MPRKKSSVRSRGPINRFAADAQELDSFFSTLDLSGSLTLLLSKPKKKSSTKK